MTFSQDKFDYFLKLTSEKKEFDYCLLAKKILSLIDLTSLNKDDTEEKITDLCRQAKTKYGSVAAVCFYPKFIVLARELLKNSNIKVATVVNFPNGDHKLEEVITQIAKAIDAGADEIDLVWPYHLFLQGDQKGAKEMVRRASVACGGQAHLKVILETGAFSDYRKIYTASCLVIDAGADFLKTSTGKIKIGATPESACAMLMAIKDRNGHGGHHVGFKASGGIQTLEQAQNYIALAEIIMGDKWITADVFRFGASMLFNNVLETCCNFC